MSNQQAEIHAVAKQSGELALLGAIVQTAVQDAKAGDAPAVVWLKSRECLDILVRIAPAGIDPRCLQQRIIMKVEGNSDD